MRTTNCYKIPQRNSHKKVWLNVLKVRSYLLKIEKQSILRLIIFRLISKASKLRIYIEYKREKAGSK